MHSQQACQRYIEGLDEATKTILAQMDNFEIRSRDPTTDLSPQVIQLLMRTADQLESIADKLVQAGAADKRHQHLEALLLLLAWAPNAHAYWYIQQLIESRPDVYHFLYQKIVADKPLQLYAKKVRERLAFHIKRQAVSLAVFNRETMTLLLSALEALRRGK